MLSIGPIQLNLFKAGKWSGDASNMLSRHFTPCDSNIGLLPMEFLSPGDASEARPLTENTHTCLCTQTTRKSLAPGLLCLENASEMHISSKKQKNYYNCAFIKPSQNITPCCKCSRKLKSHPIIIVEPYRFPQTWASFLVQRNDGNVVYSSIILHRLNRLYPEQEFSFTWNSSEISYWERALSKPLFSEGNLHFSALLLFVVVGIFQFIKERESLKLL